MSRYCTLLVGILISTAFAASLLSSSSASAATTTVPVGDFYFCSPASQGGVCTTTINAGDTVTWDFSSQVAAHTVTGSSFDSGMVSNHGTFQFTFTSAGSFDYHCSVHPTQMRGTIVVNAVAAPTATTVPGNTPAAGATATPVPSGPTGGGGLPTTGYGGQAHEQSPWWAFGALALLGATLISFGALGFARRRR